MAKRRTKRKRPSVRQSPKTEKINKAVTLGGKKPSAGKPLISMAGHYRQEQEGSLTRSLEQCEAFRSFQAAGIPYEAKSVEKVIVKPTGRRWFIWWPHKKRWMTFKIQGLPSMEFRGTVHEMLAWIASSESALPPYRDKVELKEWLAGDRDLA